MSNYLVLSLIFTIAGAFVVTVLFVNFRRAGMSPVIALAIVFLVLAGVFSLLDTNQAKQKYHDNLVTALQRLEPNAVLGSEVGSRYSGVYWVTLGEKQKILACVPDFDHCVIYAPQTPPQ